METRIKTTDYTLTPEVASYLDEKLGMIAKLVTDPSAHCDVEIGRAVGHSQQGDIWKAEITLTFSGERLRAMATEESINAAIDIVKDEMMQQLRKTKGKSSSLSRRAGLKVKEWLRFGRGE